VVEDHEDLRKLTMELLKKQGYQVLIASDGIEALDICEKYREEIHLLLVDVVMPKMTGPELAHGISILCPGIKVLYMSGYPDDVIADHGILKPGIKYIQKPFALERIAQKVREVLEDNNA